MSTTLRSLPLVTAGLVLIALSSGLGSTFQSADNVRISPLHEIDDDFYAVAENITVDGSISGDLFGLSSQINIKGKIFQSANLACRYADHSGSIDGSLRWLGERLTINGRVGGSVLAAGVAIMIRQGSVVEKDVHAYAKEIDLDGNILGNVDCAGNTIRITGQIGGNVELTAKKIIISPPAVIRGDLTYETESEDQFTLEPGVTVIGTIAWQPPDQVEATESSGMTGIAFRIAALLAAFIFGAILISLFREYADESIHQLRDRTSVSLAAGLLGLLALGLAIIVLGLALAGSAIGSILLSGDLPILGIIVLVLSILMIPISSFITVSGAVIFYSAQIIVGLVVGHWLLRLIRPSASKMSKTSLLVGLIILTLTCAIPYVGLIVCFLAALVGSGSIILGVRNCHKTVKSQATAVVKPDVGQ